MNSFDYNFGEGENRHDHFNRNTSVPPRTKQIDTVTHEKLMGFMGCLRVRFNSKVYQLELTTDTSFKINYIRVYLVHFFIRDGGKRCEELIYKDYYAGCRGEVCNYQLYEELQKATQAVISERIFENVEPLNNQIEYWT